MTAHPLMTRAGTQEPSSRAARPILRRPHRDDADAIFDGLSDIAVARMLARVPFPYYRQDAVDWLARIEDGEADRDVHTAIADADGNLIGCVGIEDRPGGPILGYWLARRFWRRGIMTEALSVTLGRYLAHHPGAVVRSGVFADNRASLHLQEKLGFRVVGISEVYCTARLEMLNHVDTVLTAADFEGRPG